MEGLIVDRPSGLYKFMDRGKAYSFPSVTAVTRTLTDTMLPAEYYLERGQKVHTACALLDGEDGLDWDTLSPVLAPFVRGYQRFLDESKVQIRRIEYPVRSLKYGYAGRLDRVVFYKSRLYLIDLKVNAPGIATGAQLAAYGQAYRETADLRGAIRRLALELRDNESYRLHQYRDVGDFSVFLAGLTLYNWKRSLGL